MKLLYKTDIGIDLGTSTVLVYAKGQGIILREPSVVAVERSGGQIYAIGDEAKNIIGRAPSHIAVIRPLKEGVISNYDITARMLKYFLRKVAKISPLFRPRLVACVPSLVTEAEQRFLVEAAKEAGAKDCYLIQEPVAAAIGAGIDISKPKGTMIVDIGGGTSDVAIISCGNVVISDSIRFAGDSLNESIRSYLKNEKNLMVGINTAEQIKINNCRAFIDEKIPKVSITGRNTKTGLPETISLSPNEFVNALRDPLNQLHNCIKALLEKTPPELASDLKETGIILTGGGSLLKGLDVYLNQKTKLPVHYAEDPVACVAIGTGKVLEDTNTYGRAIFQYRRGEYYDDF